MKRLAAFLLWTCVFLILLVVLDQVLLRVPFRTSGLREVREFHLDIRNRLLHLQGIEATRHPTQPENPSPAAQEEEGRPSVAPVREAEEETASGYVYADASGNLQFADSLEEVPARFRRDARPLQP